MLAATKRWFRRNRTPIAIGAGVIGAGYVVTHYVLGKLQDARERMSSDRIAKENLRRRFEQNQEDCTFTVLALLPTATTNILEAMNTEKITYEIQQMKGSAVARTKSIGSTSPPSLSDANATDDDGRSIFSVSVQSEAGVHTSQISVPAPLSNILGEASAPAVDGAQEAVPITPQKPKKTKRQLWDDLTISSITRAYTLLYTLSLLTMLTRIQLNLLGRRSYLSSVVSLATGSAQQTISLENNDDDAPEHYYGSDFEVNRRYLTFSWWLLNRGWVDVMQRVETAVRQVFGHLSPRDTVTIENFLQLTSNVRTLVEGSSPSSGVGTAWLRFLLPPEKLEDFVLRESGILDESSSPSSPPPTSDNDDGSVTAPTSVQLRRLLDETADLIDSPTFSNVLTQILDAGFETLKGQLAKDVVGVSTITEDMSGFTSRAVLLPKILSVLTRQAHDIGNGMPNRYLQAMEQVRDLEGFAAVVYSSNWQAEIAQDEELEVLQREQQQQPQRNNSSGGGSVSGLVGGERNGGGSGSGLEGSTVVGGGEESLVVVGADPQGSFEGAWERAMGESR
ncbi:Peroxin-3 [Apiosordaria backusii]|uniref:Peroxin-3 n=1 Tax=Apiosordaria backusii TaxID=314023 RepID=A0AA40BEH7_9PEZI|nr:Peroxin-3 [Apiosordaria backusii]